MKEGSCISYPFSQLPFIVVLNWFKNFEKIWAPEEQNALKELQNFIKERAKSFKERRDFVVDSLNNTNGLSCLKPDGAFYVFPNCKKLLGKKTKLKTDKDFVEKLLEKSEVAVVQGSAFGLEGFFRISYATSMDKLQEAMKRIKLFC